MIISVDIMIVRFEPLFGGVGLTKDWVDYSELTSE